MKVTVLLKEYDTLRQEIVGRISNRFGLVSFGSALVVFLVTQQPPPGRLVVVGLWVVFLLVLWWRAGVLIRRCSKRIAEIERKVNSLVGEDLLVWETRIGGRSWMRLYEHRQN
jgi:threonine/homoserine/homoserine lactone efflux protein